MKEPRPTRLTLLSATFVLLLAVRVCAGAAERPAKAIVLAWDGTVSAFVHQMVGQGKLPNLAKLLETGAVADDVVPVFPSKTAPGFAALITGAPPRITGISGNRVPRAPRDQFTMLESWAGFSEAPLRAETIWAAAARGGKKAVVSHIPTFAGELSGGAVRFSGYDLIAGRDGVVTKNSFTGNQEPWLNSPASEAVPIEVAFTIGQSKFFGLLIDDPSDPQAGYDSLVIAPARDGAAVAAKLTSAPAGTGGELFWSLPVDIKAAGGQAAKCYFRLFDVKQDGSDFFIYHTRPVRQLPLQSDDASLPGPTVLTFVGNGASILLQQGAFGRSLPNGGNGSAEARYLETVNFAQHQLIETSRWALDHLPWDLFLAYSPFPDEAEHQWRGYLDPTLPGYSKALAERLRPLLERAYQSADEHLGLLLDKRPANAVVALISDHGLQGIHKRLAVNQVLQRAGLLVLDGQGRVDLTKTKALYPAVNNGYLLINSRDRKGGIVEPGERDGLVQQIRELLLDLREGDTKLVKAIYDGTSDGPRMGIGGDTGGDIYMELAPGYDFDTRIAPGALITEIPPLGSHGGNPEDAAIRTLMVFHGPGIRSGVKLTGVQIIDFAPTLARLLGIPPPKHATGRTVLEAFSFSPEP